MPIPIETIRQNAEAEKAKPWQGDHWRRRLAALEGGGYRPAAKPKQEARKRENCSGHRNENSVEYKRPSDRTVVENARAIKRIRQCPFLERHSCTWGTCRFWEKQVGTRECLACLDGSLALEDSRSSMPQS